MTNKSKSKPTKQSTLKDTSQDPNALTLDESPDEIDEVDAVQPLVNMQLNCLSRAEKAISNYKKDPKDRKQLRPYYQAKLMAFEKLVVEFEGNHREIVTAVDPKRYPEMEYFRDDIPDQFENLQIEFITTVNTGFQLMFPDAAPIAGNAQNAQLNESHAVMQMPAALPAIELGKFTGLPSDWKTFRDTFRTIIYTNTQLSNVNKFHYLKSCLTGEAADIISTFTVCDADYPNAWKALVDTYNDKPSMFAYAMNKFLSTESIASENPEQLRMLLKTTSACLTLDTIGIPQKHVDEVISHQLLRKLPADTIAYWEQTRKKDELPNFNAVRTCIETRIRISAAVATINASSTAKPANNNNNQIKLQPQQQQQVKKKFAKTHHATAKSNKSTTATTAKQQQQGEKSFTSSFTCAVCNAPGHSLLCCAVRTEQSKPND